MSYSEVTDLIERVGYEKAFDEIYLNYKRSKEEFLQLEKKYNEAKSNMEHDLAQSQHFVKRAANAGLSALDNGSHYVRKVVGEEIVWFRSDGHEYAIGYEPLTNFNQ